ncbi:GTSE1 N domain containing protein [Scophthalmus maximus]|uniref:GTSE1 N domain containing protein n=1 Tax=Scophthalmus maximus TaxID=52904 RepID=A0A2U9BU88_SCOMX|nr:GTSE1 N domain containing protein [Scophthalmus maximus]
MDCRANSDLFSLHDEKFDFDVSLSPASSKGDEDEDEVFVGPVSHKERCVSVNVVSQLEDGGGGTRVSWSPLTGDQLDAVCHEAHRLATQLQGAEPSPQDGEDTRVTTEATNRREEFIQDTGAKLDVLGNTASVLSPIKRQTFCVQDSPMKQLPPAVQRRLLRGSSVNTTLSNRPAAINKASSKHTTATNAASSARPAPTVSSIRPTARHITSSPVAVTRAQATRMSLRGKAALGVGIALPSKPAAPTTSCSASKTKVEKTRLQPPSKMVAGWTRPSSRPSSRAESYEDLLSDSTSVASDLSDSSLNSSLLGKRSLAPPTKNVVRNMSGVKAPPLQKRRVADRRNTSSSSSSVSSFNSSMSLSPAKGKLNSSLNRSLSGSTGPAPGNISRPANQSRPRRSTIYAAAEPTSSAAGGRRSLSAQARKLSEAERIKAIRSTPLKRAEASTLQVTPAKRSLERTASVPPTALVRPQSGLKAKPKPEAQVVPTPSGGNRGVQQGDDISKMLKPKRLVSASSLDGLPQKPSTGPLTPSGGGCRTLQVKARRPSALPTPVRHRMSGIPPPTPTNQTRTFRLPPTPNAEPAPSFTRMESSCSPGPADMQEEEPVDAPDIQPFCLEEEQPPAAPPCAASQPEQPESMDPGAPSQVQSEPNSNLIELETAEEINSKAPEVLLLDLPAPTPQPQEKLLIDLTNTPDLIRTGGKTCTTTQLIDLSSPLIKWSPEDKRENNALLINLSF